MERAVVEVNGFEALMRAQLSRPCGGGYRERLRRYHQKREAILPLLPAALHDRAIRRIAEWAGI
ncbi:MAG: hypothetical protein LUC30_07870 [Clostridiales bacterium]|nr:hypothetical protein [Clostridiales bacterium]